MSSRDGKVEIAKSEQGKDIKNGKCGEKDVETAWILPPERTHLYD